MGSRGLYPIPLLGIKLAQAVVIPSTATFFFGISSNFINCFTVGSQYILKGKGTLSLQKLLTAWSHSRNGSNGLARPQTETIQWQKLLKASILLKWFHVSLGDRVINRRSPIQVLTGLSIAEQNFFAIDTTKQPMNKVTDVTEASCIEEIVPWSLSISLTLNTGKSELIWFLLFL